MNLVIQGVADSFHLRLSQRLECSQIAVRNWVMGVSGFKDDSVDMLSFRQAMAVPLKWPESNGDVIEVETLLPGGTYLERLIKSMQS